MNSTDYKQGRRSTGEVDLVLVLAVQLMEDLIHHLQGLLMVLVDLYVSYQ